MNKSFLLKGFEVELFTGRQTGENVGISELITQELSEFVQEPDHRNIEYITSPISEYSLLKKGLVIPRIKLRNWLESKGLTILPGSTLSLGDSSKFERADPCNPYHDLIEKEYGTRVVTASIHINLGIEDLSVLFAALRLVRCEASLFLSASASSPFLDGNLTGAHSQRWLQFPLTPQVVPIFVDHSHYVSWVEDQLKTGKMWNERHLWTSVRPNGPNRPYELNRLELRICDLITNCDLLLAVTALLELRILRLCESPSQFDPLQASKLTVNELSDLSDMNDASAARNSLDAVLHHWVDGKPVLCRDWLRELLDDVSPLASEMNLTEKISPLVNLLEQGNQAMKWMGGLKSGKTIQAVLQEDMLEMELEETSYIKVAGMLG